MEPALAMGVPGVEYFAHAFEMAPRLAREFLMLGEKMSAARAYELQMINRVVPREVLLDEALAIGERLATRSRFSLALAKQLKADRFSAATGLPLDARWGVRPRRIIEMRDGVIDQPLDRSLPRLRLRDEARPRRDHHPILFNQDLHGLVRTSGTAVVVILSHSDTARLESVYIASGHIDIHQPPTTGATGRPQSTLRTR